MRKNRLKKVKLEQVGVLMAVNVDTTTEGLKTYSSYCEMVANKIYRKYGSVTVDDMRAVLTDRSIPLRGYRWCRFFASGRWSCIGQTASNRLVSKGRVISVWVRNI